MLFRIHKGKLFLCNQCILCLSEKYEIAYYKGDNLLNKRAGILGRHRNKYKLKNCDSKD